MCGEDREADGGEEGEDADELPWYPAHPIEVATTVARPVGDAGGDGERGRGGGGGPGCGLRGHCGFVMSIAMKI